MKLSPRAAALAAMIAGAVAVLGFSPLDFFPATVAALLTLVHLWRRAPTARAAAALGWLFGLGQFLAGVSWVYVSMYRFGGMPAPLAALATLGFCAFLALFPALAGWSQARLGSPLAIPAVWTLTEWLRGWLLTGFPWLATGYAAIDSPLAGFAPLGGVYLLSFATMGAAVLLWLMLTGQSRWPAAVAFASLGVAGALLGRVEWTVPVAQPVRVSLLQGNVPQSLKFDPGRYQATLETYARLAETSRGRLIVLPETAVPRFLQRIEPSYLARLDAAARRNGGDLLLGVPTSGEPGAYYNSVVSFGVSPQGRYHKVHLVPFGEFIPPGFDWFLQMMNIPLSDFSGGSRAQRPLAVAGERVAVNICYEDLYGDEIVRQLPEATLLVNVSNVAWFGDSLAPAQHLQIARMRALETGRMHLTATNTGITAAIGHDGAVLARLPQFVEDKLEVEARGRTGATPYVALVDGPALALSLLLVFFVARRGRSR